MLIQVVRVRVRSLTYYQCTNHNPNPNLLHLEKTDHSIIYAKTKIPVERFQLNTNNFLLPNFPLFQNDQGKELWEPCCNLLHIREKGDDYSLDCDDEYPVESGCPL